MIPKGALGLDYSYARPSPARLAALGVRFVSRYISLGDPKDATRVELDALHEAGIVTPINFEQRQGDVLGGAPQAELNARAAVKALERLGAPTGTDVIFSDDIAPQARQTTAEYYFRCEAILADIGAGVGLYGGYDAIAWADEDGFARGFRWQATAWSTYGANTEQAARLAAWRARPSAADVILNPNFTDRAGTYRPTAVAVHPATHVLQHYGRITLSTDQLPDSVDENICYRPFTAWGDVNQGDSDMAYLVILANGDKLIRGDSGVRRVNDFDLGTGLLPTKTYTQAQIEILDENAMGWIMHELAVYDALPASAEAGQRPLTITLSGSATPT
jgi:hypothetical protein